MSKKLDASIKCPNCGHEQKMSLFRSIWAEDADNRKLILEDKVNLFCCGKCAHQERLEFPFLCTNVERGVAIWYEPYHDPKIDEDIENYRKQMGKDSYYAKAPRIADWETFKAKFLELDAAGPQHGQEVKHSKESQEQFKGFIDSLKKDDISRASGRSISSKTTSKLTAGEFAHLLEEAGSGDKDAQYAVGGAYLNGNGVKRDLFLGERWLLAAAEQGQAAAQCDVGALYADGRILKQSYSDALKWLRKAAEQGDALAMAGLGSLYGKGFRDKGSGFLQRAVLANMSVDRVEAYKWFSLALQAGHTAATRDLWLLKRLMSADQLKAAERKIEEFARERQPPSRAKLTPAASPPPSKEQIIRDYGAMMEHHLPLPTRIDDASHLPHRKELILDALFFEMEQSHPERTIDFLKIAARSLVQFQYNVGKEPLEMLGMDISQLPQPKNLADLRQEARRLVAPQKQSADRFNELNRMVQEDERTIESRIAAADAKRKAKT